MTATRWKTAKDIVNSAAIECGLSAVADPFTSTDANFRLLVTLLNSTGNKLANKGGWEQLRKEATLTVAPGDTGMYSLPGDYRAMVDQTAWNRTGVRPLTPVSSQQAQFLKARTAGALLAYPFRQVNGQMEIVGDRPGVGTVLALEYESTSWVQPEASVEPDSNEATASTDVVRFDPTLMVCALSFYWKAKRGFDASVEKADFDEALDAERSSRPAPVLDLGGGGSGEHFIDYSNAPSTGWGLP